MHAAALIAQIKQREPEARISGFGGDRMEASGCRIVRHIRYTAFMGFAAVISHWRDVKDNFRIARNALLNEHPDVLVLIDYPSFNMQIAAFYRRHLPQIRIVWYIPPKVWAWKKWRIHRMARLCDEILGIFPFEPAFYAQYGYRCTYVGHPTVESIQQAKPVLQCNDLTGEAGLTVQRSVLALLPGSRPSEISHCLPRMLEAARRFPDCHIVVCAASGIEDTFYQSYLHPQETLTRDTYATLQSAAAAVVNSGTATLEAALIGCPQVAVYHLALSRLIGLLRWAQPLFFAIPYFTPVNIIAGKEIIKECIANDFTADKVAAELNRLLKDEAYKKELLAQYEQLRSVLGTQSASSTAADIITSIP